MAEVKDQAGQSLCSRKAVGLARWSLVLAQRPRRNDHTLTLRAVRVEASTFETNRAHLRGNRSSELGGNIMAVLLLEESRVSARPGWVGENECAHLD
jgi:hypothetical protein